MANAQADICSNGSFVSSKTSSQVTTRSRDGMAEDRQLRKVSSSAWVPPATKMFNPATTQASRNLAA